MAKKGIPISFIEVTNAAGNKSLLSSIVVPKGKIGDNNKSV